MAASIHIGTAADGKGSYTVSYAESSNYQQNGNYARPSTTLEHHADLGAALRSSFTGMGYTLTFED